MDRYVDAQTATKARLSDLRSLVKLAWDIALIFPELGDEIIADLCGDIDLIVERERPALAAAAQEDARDFWGDRMRHAYKRRSELVASLVPGLTAEGVNSRGYYVYLLWEAKGDDRPVYVGRSSALFSRLGAHQTDPAKRYEFNWVTFVDCGTEQNMIETESILIAKYRPRLNVYGNAEAR